MAESRLPRHPIASMYYGHEWPDELQEAVAQAVFVEMQWRLAPYEGRPLTPDIEYAIETQAKIALSRYVDILADWRWACYIDRISHHVVFGLQRTLDGIEWAHRYRYHQINGII